MLKAFAAAHGDRTRDLGFAEPVLSHTRKTALGIRGLHSSFLAFRSRPLRILRSPSPLSIGRRRQRAKSGHRCRRQRPKSGRPPVSTSSGSPARHRSWIKKACAFKTQACKLLAEEGLTPEDGNIEANERVFAIVMGPEHSGRVRTQGFGVTPIRFFPQSKTEEGGGSGSNFGQIASLREEFRSFHDNQMREFGSFRNEMRQFMQGFQMNHPPHGGSEMMRLKPLLICGIRGGDNRCRKKHCVNSTPPFPEPLRNAFAAHCKHSRRVAVQKPLQRNL
ncbi:hypothetical protein IEQ34_016229 [Dendrobium chrysotoxum]|uniref:Uncharacterized protein n=1 Tax=Dendrobium chrysotoxum TaxID=161865 RepID=A0AAV7FX49_DENCH|nr:hypothetical protein IEQ34_016229 [Dendrobium chrysotoxum]